MDNRVGGSRRTDRFTALRASSTALLTTFRIDGEGVATPVSITIDGGCAYFITATVSGKAKRLARDSRVTLAPCTVSGTAVGETVGGTARRLPAAAARQRRRLLRPTRALFWSHVMYRLQRRTMVIYEVTPASDEP